MFVAPVAGTGYALTPRGDVGVVVDADRHAQPVTEDRAQG